MRSGWDLDQVLDDWMESEPSLMPGHVYDAALDRVGRTKQQRPLRLTTRYRSMNTIRLLAAALLLAAVVVSPFLLFTSGQEVVEPSASPVPSPTPTPGRLPISFGELEPGTYSLTDVYPGGTQVDPDSPLFRMTVTVPVGWGGIRGRTFAHLFQAADEPMVGSVLIQVPSNFFVDPCDTAQGRWDPPVGPTVDDFVEAINDTPGYRVSTPVDIEWLGYHGKSLDETGPASVAACTDGFAHAWETEFNETAEYLVDGQHNRLLVVDIDGTRVVVTLPQSVSAPYTPGTNPASLAEQQQVLDSIRIEPLPSPEPTVTAAPSG